MTTTPTIIAKASQLEQIAEAVRFTSRRLILMGFDADVTSIQAHFRCTDERVAVSIQAETHAATNRIANYLRCPDAKESRGVLMYDEVNSWPNMAVSVFGPARERDLAEASS